MEENQCFWIIQATSSSISQVLYTLQAVSSGQNQANTKEMAVQSYKSQMFLLQSHPLLAKLKTASQTGRQIVKAHTFKTSEGYHFKNQ